ncbi:hypothetical protein [Actibacterium sp. MT2.3-13A]|uniref:hypothetical protein n=1 Tax=Actibacterium sp. MT2.3-13A TaxID=2828332 RepID=UPI001BA6F8A1|nr:hypothetical protein [Actibacterium sp. MT2.3-13A]
MMKTCSIMFTIGWAAALVFGWMALSAPAAEPPMLQVADVLLAAAGAAMGSFAWIRIKRGC